MYAPVTHLATTLLMFVLPSLSSVTRQMIQYIRRENSLKFQLSVVTSLVAEDGICYSERRVLARYFVDIVGKQTKRQPSII